MPARPDSATIVEQTLSDVFPDGMRSEQFERVEPPDLDAAGAPGAFDAEHFARDLREPPLLNGQPGRPAARGSLKRASQYSWCSGASGAGSSNPAGGSAVDAS